MKLSKNGLDLIKQFEGFKSKSYNDVGGKPTIGYGHLIKSGESFTTVTPQEAIDLLKYDTLKAVSCVNEVVKVQLTQNHFDALVSLTYNIGNTNFRNSTLLKKLNINKFQEASDQFLIWNKVRNPKTKELEFCQGLYNRRLKEKELFDKI
jgi:lysozyme